MWQELTKTVLLIVASLFPIVNPPAAAFISLGVVLHATPAERSSIAWRVAWNSLLLLLASLLMGAYVLAFFGISIPVLRIAGGIVVATAGWRLLDAPDDTWEPEPEAVAEPIRQPVRHRHDPSFYPLTLPLTVGPGAIAVAIALGTGSPAEGPSVVHFVAAAVGLLIISGSIYLCLRFAEQIERGLGSERTQVVMRLFAFVIFCIGVQILWIGLSDLIATTLLSATAHGASP
jgi:multiple antibiotic resistance protein